MSVYYTASEKDNGRKIYNILRNELNISATLVRKLKNSGGISLNGCLAYTTATVKPGDLISVDVLSAEGEMNFEPEDGELSILYENEGYIAVNKPSGMLVHPSRAKYCGSLAGIAAGYFEKSGQKAACHIVNRLDRDTGGVVLIAKSSYYKTLLTTALHENSKKLYIALLFGNLPGIYGTINFPIRREEPQKMRRIVAEDGQRAITEYKILGFKVIDGVDLSLCEFVLKTGRTHQIRVHTSYMGAPIIGDSLYGSEESCLASEKLGISSQALHAAYLGFRDPLSGKYIELNAPIDRPEFKKLVDSYF